MNAIASKLIRIVVLLFGIGSQAYLIFRNFESWGLLIGQIFFSLWILLPFLIWLWGVSGWPSLPWTWPPKTRTAPSPAFSGTTGLLLIGFHLTVLVSYFSSGSSTAALIFVFVPPLELGGVLFFFLLRSTFLLLLGAYRKTVPVRSLSFALSAPAFAVMVIVAFYGGYAALLGFVSYSDRMPAGVLRRVSESWMTKRHTFLQANLAGNASTPADILSIYAGSSSLEVVKAVAANRGTPGAALVKIAQVSKDPNTLGGVAGNPNTPPGVLQELTERSVAEPEYHWTVAAGLARNPNSTVEILEKVATTGNFNVRGSLLGNPNTSCPILEMLLGQGWDRRTAGIQARFDRQCPKSSK